MINFEKYKNKLPYGDSVMLKQFLDEETAKIADIPMTVAERVTANIKIKKAADDKLLEIRKAYNLEEKRISDMFRSDMEEYWGFFLSSRIDKSTYSLCCL